MHGDVRVAYHWVGEFVQVRVFLVSEIAQSSTHSELSVYTVHTHKAACQLDPLLFWGIARFMVLLFQRD